MASGRGVFGAMDASYYINKINSSNDYNEGLNYLQQAMNDTVAGPLNIGVSANDQNVVYRALLTFCSKYKVDLSNTQVKDILNDWDTSKTNIKSTSIGAYSSKAIDVLSSLNKTSTTSTDEIESSSGSSSSSSSSTVNYSPPTYDMSGILDEIKALREDMNRVYSGAELAKQYNIEDTLANMEYYKQLYTDATNEYYNDMQVEANKDRTNFDRNNGRYDNTLRQAYADSYANASLTNANRDALAANALSTSTNYDYNTSQSDYGMLQNKNYIEQMRNAELANTDYKAETAYNDTMQYLMEMGANHNTSDVTNYINHLNSAANRYAAERNYAGAAASANATKYSGLANANATKANDQWSNLYNYYLKTSGNSKDAYSSIASNLGIV